MIIDTHNHICPDRFVKAMEDTMMRTWGAPMFGHYNVGDPPFQDLDERSIYKAVVFNVCQMAAQIPSANDFQIKLCQYKNLVPMGNMLPDFSTIKTN